MENNFKFFNNETANFNDFCRIASDTYFQQPAIIIDGEPYSIPPKLTCKISRVNKIYFGFYDILIKICDDRRQNIDGSLDPHKTGNPCSYD